MQVQPDLSSEPWIRTLPSTSEQV